MGICDPAFETRDTRRTLRDNVAQARRGLSRMRVEILDLSAAGVCIKTYDRFPVGSTLWLRLRGLAPQESIVIWEEDFVTGCEFARPLDPAVYDQIIRSDRQRFGSLSSVG